MLSKEYELRILSCDDPNKWYANKIGKTVPYLPDSSKDEWKSLQDDGIGKGHRFTNFISKEDAELVEINTIAT